MTKYQKQGTAYIDFKVSGEAVYTAATYKRFEEDIIFLRRQAEGTTDESQRKRYARIIIMLTAPYLESMSNLMFGELINKELDEVDKRTHLSAIQRFREIHHVLLHKELKLDTNGIQDIFHIRNNITLHPAGREVVKVAGEGLGRIDKHIAYKKLKSFPFVYSGFTLKEADEILREVEEFLTAFLNLLRGKVPEEQLDEWWPRELVQWTTSIDGT